MFYNVADESQTLFLVEGSFDNCLSNRAQRYGCPSGKQGNYLGTCAKVESSTLKSSNCTSGFVMFSTTMAVFTLCGRAWLILKMGPSFTTCITLSDGVLKLVPSGKLMEQEGLYVASPIPANVITCSE